MLAGRQRRRDRHSTPDAPHRPAEPRGAGPPRRGRRRPGRPPDRRRAARRRRAASTRATCIPTRWSSASCILVRGGASGRCWCALAPQRDGGRTLGYIVTFDDITALLSRPAPGGLGRGGAADRARGQEPADPDPALGRAAGAQILGPDRARSASPSQNSIATIIRQVDTIGRLISEFSAFARMPAAVLREEDVAAADRARRGGAAAVGLAAASRFTVETPPGPVLLVCDGQKVSQALTNLLQNSINALSEGRAAAAVGDRRPAAAGPTGALQIEVEDNGQGFPADGERLFEPYVTTRGPRAPAWALPSSRRSWRNMAARSSCSPARRRRPGAARLSRTVRSDRRPRRGARPPAADVPSGPATAREHGQAHEQRHPDRRRRGGHPRGGGGHPGGRGLPAARGRQQRRGLARDRARGRRAWCCSTSGSRAARSTACRSSSGSRRSIPRCR